MILPEEGFIGNSKAEEYIWNRFNELLPSSYVSFHNYYLGLKQPDIMLLVPNKGVLIIEIKGFLAKNIIDVPSRAILRVKNQPPITSPLDQAMKYRNIFINEYLIKNYIDSVYVVPSVCYPYISKMEYNLKGLNKISDERITIMNEDLNDSKSIIDKIDTIFELAYDSISIPSLKKFDFDNELLEKVGNIISNGFRNNTETNNTLDKLKLIEDNQEIKREFYSQLVYHKSSSDFSEEKKFKIINNWLSGTKIYLFSDDKNVIDSVVQSIKEKIDHLNLSEVDDFKLLGNNSFNFISDCTISLDKNFEIFDGNSHTEYLDDLEILHNNSAFNKDQYFIEHAPIDDLIIKAGAGTGKTFSIISRINYLIWTKQYTPEEFKKAIAMITFTNESADVMKEKLSNNFINYYLLTKNIDFLKYIESVEDMNISTIHSLSKKIIKKYSSYIGLGQKFKIVTGNYKRRQFLQRNMDDFFEKNNNALEDIDISIFHLTERLQSFLEKLDNKNIDIVEENDSLNFGISNKKDFHKLLNVMIATQYDINSYLKSNNSIALGELIKKMRVIYKTISKTQLTSNSKVDFLFVDEFQDTDDVQIELMTSFKKIFGFNFFVVGDVKQCIYRFRGAEVKAFDTLINNNDNFINTISLNKNYRTDTLLLNKLNNIFSKWDEKNNIEYSGDDVLKGTKKYCSKDIFYKITYDSAEVMEEKLITTLKKIDENYLDKNGKIAILVRYNWQVSKIREICEKHKISIDTDIGGELFKIDPTMDLFKLVSALKFNRTAQYILNLYSTSFVSEIMPKSFIYDLDKEEVIDYFYENLPSKLLKWESYIERLRTEPILKLLRDIVDDVKPWEVYAKKIALDEQERDKCESYYIKNLDYLFEKLILASNTEYLTINKISEYLEIMILTKREEEARASYDIENSSKKVICTTVHKSKGLEFDSVILPYCSFDISGSQVKGDVDIIYSGKNVGYRILGNEYSSIFENDLYKQLQEDEVIDRRKEEARILYVALTRAIKRIVYFTSNEKDKKKYKITWESLIEEGLDENLNLSKSI